MKKSLSLILCLLLALLPVKIGADDYTPIGQVFTGVRAPYMTEGGLPSATDFFTDEDFASHRITLLNLWDSSCVNCRIELPFFQQAYETYGSDGLNIVGVATTILGGNYPDAYELVMLNRLTYPQVIIDSGIHAVADNLFFVPQTYAVNSGGEVVGFFGGFATYGLLEKELLGLLMVAGDANCDGEAAFADASTLAACLTGSGALSALGTLNCDMDGDGALTSLDLTLLCREVLGTIKQLNGI